MTKEEIIAAINALTPIVLQGSSVPSETRGKAIERLNELMDLLTTEKPKQRLSTMKIGNGR